MRLWTVVLLLALVNLVLFALHREALGMRPTATDVLVFAPPTAPKTPQARPIDFASLARDRDTWQKPAEVIRHMGLKPDDRIADVGAYCGYWSWRFAPIVGDAGRVFAVDIDGAMSIPFLHEWKEEHGYSNVDVVWSKPDDVGLDPASLDHGFMCDAHFFLERDLHDESLRCLTTLFQALRPGGRLTVIERRYNRALGGAVSLEQLREPFAHVGFTFESSSKLLLDEPPARDAPENAPRGQYLVVFRRP